MDGRLEDLVDKIIQRMDRCTHREERGEMQGSLNMDKVAQEDK